MSFLMTVLLRIYLLHEILAVTDDFSNQNLTSVPASISASVITLILDSNNITEFADNDFSTFTSLATFKANYNLITSVSALAFSGTSIKRIELTGNLLTTIPAFSGFTSLLKLYLDDNLITTMDVSVLPPHKVRVLYLSSNPFTTVDASSFSSLAKIQWLDVFDCGLGNITGITADIISNLGKKLQKITLGNNTLNDQDVECFSTSSQLKNLQFIMLSYNKLTKIPDFHSIPRARLREIAIGKNQITSIDYSTSGTHFLSRFDGLF